MSAKKKGILLWVLFLSVIFLGGCETTKGAGTGVAAIAEGAGKDTVSLWQGILKVDDWIKKNLW